MSYSLTRLVFASLLVVAAALVVGCGSGKSHKTPELPGVVLSATSYQTDQDVAASSTTTIAHIMLEAPGLEDVSIASVTLTAQGTGNEAVDVTQVEIYLDVNGNGAFDSGTDSLLGSGSYDADNGSESVTFSSPLIVSPGTGNERYWLVRYQLNGNGPDGATYSFAVSGVDVSFMSGKKTYASGLPLASATLTITSGGARLNLLEGPNPPADREVIKGRSGIAALQFTLYNRDPGDITVTSVRITPSGSGNDASEISGAFLRIDANGNGRYDGGEALFGSFTYSADNTAVDVSGSKVISPNTMVHFLVVYDLDASASVGSTFRAGIAAANHIQAEDSSMVSVVPVGSVPLQGALITVVEKGTLSVQIGANNPAGGAAYAGTDNVSVLQIELLAGTIEDVTLDSLTITATGNANDAADFTGVDLYIDTDGDATVDAGETLLGSGSYSVDDGTIVFSSLGLNIPSGGSRNVLVAYDIEATALNGALFGAYVATTGDVVAQGVESSLDITPSGTFPSESDMFEIMLSDTFISVASLNTSRFMHTQTTFTDPGDGRVKVLVCGGSDGTTVLQTAEVYDPAFDTWTPVAASMTKRRMEHTATLLADGERIVIAGGTPDAMVTTHQDGEMFDPATYTFTAISDLMASRRQMHTAVLTAEGDVFYVGGQYIYGSLLYVDDTEYYNEPVNRFDLVGASQYVRILHTMNRLSGGTIIVTAGLGYSSSGPSSTSLLKSIQIWRTSPTIVESRSWLTLAGYGRCGHVAVSMSSGRLLIAGGYNVNIFLYTTPPFTGRKTAEVIHENAAALGDESIEDVGDMSAVRFMPVGELLPDGRVLIAGGADDSSLATALATAELYDPSAESFVNTARNMKQARYRATSSMLPGPDGVLGTSDDTVLIVGGLTQYAPSPAPAQVTSSAEVYAP
jgi:hypothetical protein